MDYKIKNNLDLLEENFGIGIKFKSSFRVRSQKTSIIETVFGAIEFKLPKHLLN